MITTNRRPDPSFIWFRQQFERLMGPTAPTETAQRSERTPGAQQAGYVERARDIFDRVVAKIEPWKFTAKSSGQGAATTAKADQPGDKAQAFAAFQKQYFGVDSFRSGAQTTKNYGTLLGNPYAASSPASFLAAVQQPAPESQGFTADLGDLGRMVG